MLSLTFRGHKLALAAALVSRSVMRRLMTSVMRRLMTSVMRRSLMASMVSAATTLQRMLFHLPSVMCFLLGMSGAAESMVLFQMSVSLLQVMVSCMKMLGHFLSLLDFEHKKSGPQNPDGSQPPRDIDIKPTCQHKKRPLFQTK
jgi:hypothetical protein